MTSNNPVKFLSIYIPEQAEPEPEPLTPDQYDRGGELTDSVSKQKLS